MLLLLPPLWAQARDRGAAEHLPLPVLDLDRYGGSWHHLAWLPEGFQEKCVSGSTVDYRRRGDGGFDVHRSCLDADGRMREEDAEAVPVPGAPGSLQMRTASRWRAWLPMGWKRRWVIAVGPAYEWAMVGSPDRDRLWIIARQPSIDRASLEGLVAQARDMGYPVGQLVMPPDLAKAAAQEQGTVPAELVVSTNEPFWHAVVDGASIHLTGPDRPQPRRLAVEPGRPEDATASRRLVRGRDSRGEVVVEVVTEACQDNMSGAWFPLTATLWVDGAAPVAGCARPSSMPAPGEGG